MTDPIEVPSLTLDPFGSTSPAAPEPPQALVEKPLMEEPALSPEERKMVNDFADKINLQDSNMILLYGAGAQKKIADFSESALGNIRSKDLGEVGQMLTDVVTELKGFEIEEEDKGILGFFKRSSNKLTTFRAKYEKAETNIERICGVLEGHQMQLLKDIAMLDKMYELNKTYFKELSMYILAGKQKLEQTRSVDLPAMVRKAESGLPEDAQAANDLANLCTRFEKKLHDLELTRMVSLQMAPQIRLVQNNNTLMSEKIQSTLVNTVPLWKSQIVLAIGVSHSEQAARAQREVSNMTNELLRKNAATLKMATIETAKESERGIVDLETLRTNNEMLISTLDEVLRIQTEGHEKRKQAEVELAQLESQLKNKLLEIRR